MNFHMSAQTLGEFVRVRQLINSTLGIEVDLNSDEFMTQLFETCGSSGQSELCDAADKLWSFLTLDNPEIDKRKQLNQLHHYLQNAMN